MTIGFLSARLDARTVWGREAPTSARAAINVRGGVRLARGAGDPWPLVEVKAHERLVRDLGRKSEGETYPPMPRGVGRASSAARNPIRLLKELLEVNRVDLTQLNQHQQR